jgi:hypothetical protein
MVEQIFHREENQDRQKGRKQSFVKQRALRRPGFIEVFTIDLLVFLPVLVFFAVKNLLCLPARRPVDPIPDETSGTLD